MTRMRCPHCEHETAQILYGFTIMDDKLQKDINEQRTYLVRREKRIPLATRHCFHCDKDVCYTFLLVDEAFTTSVEFEIGGFQNKNRAVLTNGLHYGIDL